MVVGAINNPDGSFASVVIPRDSSNPASKRIVLGAFIYKKTFSDKFNEDIRILFSSISQVR
jgi:hypothetical protein